MSVSAQASGTKTAEIGTEHSLSTPSEPGSYTFHVDKNAMAAGDVLELRVYQKVLSGGTLRVAYYTRFDGVQPEDDKIAVSVPISTDLAESEALKFTLKQVAGTGRAFPWKILRYA